MSLDPIHRGLSTASTAAEESIPPPPIQFAATTKPVEMTAIVDMSQFMTEVDLISSFIKQLQATINNLRSIHTRVVSDPITSASTSPSTELTHQTSQSTSLANEIRQRLNTLNQRNKMSNQRDTEGFATRKKLIVTLQGKFKSVLEDLFKVEKDARDRYRARIERQYRLVKPEASAEEVDQVISGSSQGRQVFADALLTARSREATSTLRAAQQRSDDLRSIEGSLIECAQVLNDMALLVTEQDDAFVTLERQAGDVQVDTERGHQEVSRGVRYARAARKKRVWLTILVLVILGAIAIAIAVPIAAS